MEQGLETSYSVTVTLARQDGVLIAPHGISTDHATSLGCEVRGGEVAELAGGTTGQTILKITPTADHVEVVYRYSAAPAAYAPEIFKLRDNRYTRAADALVAEAQAIAPDAPEMARARAIACAVAEKFTYGHPATRYYDDHQKIPHLGCGITPGSCVDINAYFIASLRAAGIETGYITGYFFPAEKGDHCDDAHCWVVTRINGRVYEWDIAHFLKMGSRKIYPGLNPKPGFRTALAHSMGLSVPQMGVTEMKLLSDPLWISPDGDVTWPLAPKVRLTHHGMTTGTL